MSSAEEFQEYEYVLKQKWTVTKIIRSYESDEKLAYIHGFNAGIDLLCEKATLSRPAIAQSVRKLASEMVEETKKTLHLLRPNEIIIRRELDHIREK